MVYQHRERVTPSDVRLALRKAGIPDDRYCIGGYGECCVCIEPTVNGWIIYDGERGQRFNTINCTSLSCLVDTICDRLGYEKTTTISPSYVKTAKKGAGRIASHNKQICGSSPLSTFPSHPSLYSMPKRVLRASKPLSVACKKNSTKIVDASKNCRSFHGSVLESKHCTKNDSLSVKIHIDN